jgi:hypothetical protein
MVRGSETQTSRLKGKMVIGDTLNRRYRPSLVFAGFAFKKFPGFPMGRNIHSHSL